MGPTAAGKTDLALHLAEQYPVELISVDSALVYRGMDIGTAKPSKEILKQFPHHLVNIIEPTAHYSVGDFRRDALNCMIQITEKGKVPVLVGGTMLYFNALQNGLAELPEADPEIRASLTRQAEEKGLAFLHQLLQKVDPESARRIHPNDPQRLQRALEVYEITGKSLTELITHTQQPLPYQLCKLVISPFQRRVLHQRIADRYHHMMTKGFLKEMQVLYQTPGLTPDLPSMRCVGYRQMWQHLAGEYDQETAIEKAIIATRQMAKRQITWLRSQPDATWFDSGKSLPVDLIESFLNDKLFV